MNRMKNSEKIAPFRLYVASCDRDGGIYEYRVSDRGDAEEVGFTPMDRPMYFAYGDGRMHVLLRAPFADERQGSGLVTCEMDADGHLAPPSEPISTMGEVACHLSVVGDDVYAVNYISGNVVRMPDRLAVHSGRSVHPVRQTAPHTHFVSPTGDGRYLAVTDLGTDRIYLYRRDLSLVSTATLPAGQGPRHLAFHADGEHVFCANELTSTVSLLSYRDGGMTLCSTVSVLPEDYPGESTAAAIRCVGDTVYVSNRGHDSVTELGFSGDRLIFRRTIPVYGESPRDFIVHGGLILSANERSDEVTLVALDSGALVSRIPVKTPICVAVG